jgi:hypothetical protein
LDASASLDLSLNAIAGASVTVDSSANKNSTASSAAPSKAASSTTKVVKSTSVAMAVKSAVLAAEVTSAKAAASSTSTKAVTGAKSHKAKRAHAKHAKAAKALVAHTGRADVSVQSPSVDGCIDIGAGFDVNAGAEGSFFSIFNAQTQVTLFSKKFDLFKVLFSFIVV